MATFNQPDVLATVATPHFMQAAGWGRCFAVMMYSPSSCLDSVASQPGKSRISVIQTIVGAPCEYLR